jgi:hypothetical protein
MLIYRHQINILLYGLKTEDLRFNLQQGEETFFFFQVPRLGLVSIQSYIEWVLGTLSPSIKWPEIEAAQGHVTFTI